jgi:hypothetical protein
MQHSLVVRAKASALPDVSRFWHGVLLGYARPTELPYAGYGHFPIRRNPSLVPPYAGWDGFMPARTPALPGAGNNTSQFYYFEVSSG